MRGDREREETVRVEERGVRETVRREGETE